MKKNVNLNLNKNILLVSLAFVFFFCFVRVDCFALQSPNSSYPYVYWSGSGRVTVTDNPNLFLIYLTDATERITGMYFASFSPTSYNAVVYDYNASSDTFSSFSSRTVYLTTLRETDIGTIYIQPWTSGNAQAYIQSYPGSNFYSDFPVYISGEDINKPNVFDNNLPLVHFEVFYNTPLLLRDSLVIKCMDRPLSVLDSYSKFDVELSEPSGTIFFSDSFHPNQFGNISGEVRVPGVFDNVDFNGTVYYKIIPYAENGDWGNTILGSFQLGSSGSGEPLDNPYITPSVDGIDIVGTVPVVSTTVQDKDTVPSTYLSPSNLPNVSYTTNNYYVYETNNTEEVDNLNTDYITYNINYSGSESTESGFGIIKNFFDDDFYKESNNAISWFSNMFPFISDIVVKPLSKIIALILGSTVVLIGVKIWHVLH